MDLITKFKVKNYINPNQYIQAICIELAFTLFQIPNII